MTKQCMAQEPFDRVSSRTGARSCARSGIYSTGPFGASAHFGFFAFLLAALTVAVLAAGTPARAQSDPAAADQIALVKVVDGQAFALRADERSALGVGTPIFVQDVVETEAGSVGLTFKDGSRISIGPNSRVQFTEFQFSPAEGRLAFIMDIFRGTLLYVSGVIAKLSPDAVKVQTPVATVAVRGTRFLAEVEGD